MLHQRLTEAIQCADITFSDDADELSDSTCKNGTGVSGATVGNVDSSSSSSSSPSSTSEAASASSSSAAGGSLQGPATAAMMAAGLFAVMLGL